jgi:hypothetical protein
MGADVAPEDIEFDPEKDFRNRLKHGFSLQRAKDLDWDRAFIKADLRFDYGGSGISPLA